MFNLNLPKSINELLIKFEIWSSNKRHLKYIEIENKKSHRFVEYKRYLEIFVIENNPKMVKRTIKSYSSNKEEQYKLVNTMDFHYCSQYLNPLTTALKYGFNTCANILIEYGADKTHRNNSSGTAEELYPQFFVEKEIYELETLKVWDEYTITEHSSNWNRRL